MWRHWATQTFMVLLLGCGGSDASDDPPPPSAPTASAPEPSTPEPTSDSAPEVQLTWLSGGVLALENASAVPVSLARELSMTPSTRGEPTRVLLGLDCSSRDVTPAGAEACITLVPGAALALGSWPNDHGACRCPPCARAGEDTSFVIRSCDRRHELSRSLPPRERD